MRPTPPIVLTIAGFDPSSGAGVTADIKTIAAHGCYGLACITALTVQSTTGVRRAVSVEAFLVSETLEELAGDFNIAAIHIGMLGSGGVVKAVASFLQRHKAEKVVLDPVLRSSSGAPLLDEVGKSLLINELVPLACVVTPNLDEAAALTGIPVSGLEDMEAAAAKLHTLGAASVVITGGHLAEPTDLLSQGASRQIEVFRSDKLESTATHGTGCAFATSIACELALGKSLRDAVEGAKAYVFRAIEEAYPVGRGVGPLNHFSGR